MIRKFFKMNKNDSKFEKHFNVNGSSRKRTNSFSIFVVVNVLKKVPSSTQGLGNKKKIIIIYIVACDDLKEKLC